jgi:hypothetical protein
MAVRAFKVRRALPEIVAFKAYRVFRGCRVFKEILVARGFKAVSEVKEFRVYKEFKDKPPPQMLTDQYILQQQQLCPTLQTILLDQQELMVEMELELIYRLLLMDT